MQRLIDAERIVYSWIIDKDGEEHDGITLQSIINKMPTVDAEPVVRCKDCKWGTPHLEGDEYTKCFKLCTTFFSGHYCAWGERREDA